MAKDRAMKLCRQWNFAGRTAIDHRIFLWNFERDWMFGSKVIRKVHIFLAHLSRRLIWWAYRIGRTLSSTAFKKHLLRNHWANQSNFIWSFYGMGEWKFAQTVLVPYPYMEKTLKNLSGTKRLMTLKLGMQHWVLEYNQVVDHDLFYGKVKFGPLCFCMGKKVKQWIFQKLLSSMIWN